MSDSTPPTLDAPDAGAQVRASTPARLGRYRLLHELGEGGMGVVHAAFDEQLDRKVALKFLTKASSSGERLAREARSLARLAHPNVVTVYEVGEAEGVPYLAMEYVPGQTLRAWLVEPRSRLEILGMFASIGSALAAAHEVGVVHRDFKPDNVIVGPQDRPRVLDFGLARVAGEAAPELEPGSGSGPSDSDSPEPGQLASLDASRTKTGTILGTPAYMAPEQWEGRQADARSDQFAFAVALFEALYGSAPFPASTTAELMTKVLDVAPIEIPSGERVGAELHAAILRGLAKLPDERWPAMAPLLAAIDRALRRVQPGLFGRGRTAAAFGVGLVMASTMWLLPVGLLGLEFGGVVAAEARHWALLSGAQVMIAVLVALTQRRRILSLVSDPRLVAGPLAVATLLLGHRAITFATGGAIEVMFAYDFLTVMVFAGVMTYLVERALWPLVGFNLALSVVATIEPSVAPRLWALFSVGVPILLLTRALRVRDPMREAGSSRRSSSRA